MVELSTSERRAVEVALAATRDRRHWVRLRAVLLTADGVPSPEVCRDLGLGRSTLFSWLAAWRETRDPAALADAPRSGHPPVLDTAQRARLEQLLDEAPETHGYKTVGWTAPLLAHHFTAVEGGPVSETSLRRVLHGLGYRWKRPRYVLARRDPERAGRKKALAVEVARVRAEEPNTVVLCEDETILRGFPPLRACWGKVGQPVEVAITGSNARRVVFGALNPFTGTRLCQTATRNSGPAFRTSLERLRGTYKRWDILLILDRASSHTAKATAALAAELRIGFAWLPAACPELNPIEALWRDGKQRVCANRAYDSVDDQAQRFTEHLCSISDTDALRLAGLQSGNFWLTTWNEPAPDESASCRAADVRR